MLLVLQSIIVYGLMIWVMTFWGKYAYKVQYPEGFRGVNRFGKRNLSITTIITKNYFLIPIFVFCFFTAFRFKVGVDCESYKQIFYDLNRFGESVRRTEIEPLFVFLSKITYAITQFHYLLFFILALLQIGLYYYSCKRNTYVLIFLSIVLFLSGEYWSWMNGVRQNIAACTFVAITPLLINRKWWHIGILMFLAMQMHKSALIIAPLCIMAYFLKNKILNKYLQLCILLLAFSIMNKFNTILLDYGVLAGEAGYDETSIAAYSEMEETNRTFGFRMILLYAVHTIVIWFSDRMALFYKDEKFNMWYNLYFIGICLSVVFYNSFTMTRILYYLVIFMPLVLSHLLFYFYHNKMGYLLFISILLLIIRTIYTMNVNLVNVTNETFFYKFDIWQQ